MSRKALTSWRFSINCFSSFSKLQLFPNPSWTWGRAKVPERAVCWLPWQHLTHWQLAAPKVLRQLKPMELLSECSLCFIFSPNAQLKCSFWGRRDNQRLLACTRRSKQASPNWDAIPGTTTMTQMTWTGGQTLAKILYTSQQHSIRISDWELFCVTPIQASSFCSPETVKWPETFLLHQCSR